MIDLSVDQLFQLVVSRSRSSVVGCEHLYVAPSSAYVDPPSIKHRRSILSGWTISGLPALHTLLQSGGRRVWPSRHSLIGLCRNKKHRILTHKTAGCDSMLSFLNAEGIVVCCSVALYYRVGYLCATVKNNIVAFQLRNPPPPPPPPPHTPFR